ncbi:hypothetical protein PBI_THONKO_12 [Mycobacterium phage Thonko]|uniref:Uncharacterized protein n=1 Tax=Mycobacterium phage Thonko TaxID=2282910 RepID=A0A346FC59_9CAUD|nr:hypothetical protein I5G57_gp012 [Mycobacterium phage Thonko]AXN53284.1 hypothetical protein PBI_THONKO_12 [Mycobacterium phage Thonko]
MSVTFYADGTDLDVNMSNRNAALVADALGIDLDADGWCGSATADDFMGRVVMALALAPSDEGMPSYEHVGPGARMVEGARRPGYLQERLRELHELAEWAVAHSAEVVWC